MKIVHVANFYGPNSGGIKTTLHALGKGYLEHGHEFIYIVPGTRLQSEVTAFGRKIELPSFILPGSGGYQMIKSNKQLKKVLAELNPDRLEVSDRFTLLSLGRWARSRNIPSLAFSHETLDGLAKRFLPLPHALRTPLVNWHNRKLASSFDQIIATTDFAAREFKTIDAKNLVKVPLGVELTTFHPKNRDANFRTELLNGSQLLLVHCGRLSPEKEPQRSGEALKELRARGIDARLIIIGTGPMWKKIRAMSQGLPVETLGYICDRNRVAKILSAADISLAPGPLETFCLAALESLASGTPVVASQSSAVGEFLGIDQAIPAGAVARDTGNDFADAIQSLLKIPGIRAMARSVAEELPWTRSVALMHQVHGISAVGNLAPSVTTRRRVKIEAAS